MTLSEEQLKAIEARAAATPGPWAWDPAYGTFMHGPECQMVCDSKEPDYHIRIRGVGANLPQEDNASFIAHSREDIPALIAEVRRLRTENTKQRTGLCIPCYRENVDPDCDDDPDDEHFVNSCSVCGQDQEGI